MIVTVDTSSAGRGRLGDTVGAQRIGWDYARAGHYPYDFWFAFCYPAAAPFNGMTMNWCAASIAVLDDPTPLPGPLTTGIGCDMTKGASGGGWILSFKMGSAGILNGVNSYKYTNPAQPLAMYSPYFDSINTQPLWNAARVLFP